MSETLIEVREARPEDAATIVLFQQQMAWETESYRLDGEIVSKGVDAVFADRGKGIYYVAEIAGEVVASTLTVPEWSEWRNGTVIWIHSVYVVPKARCKGVFRSIYRTLREMVEGDEALCGLRLYVERENEHAQNVYRALGMSDEHYTMFEWLKKG